MTKNSLSRVILWFMKNHVLRKRSTKKVHWRTESFRLWKKIDSFLKIRNQCSETTGDLGYCRKIILWTLNKVAIILTNFKNFKYLPLNDSKNKSRKFVSLYEPFWTKITLKFEKSIMKTKKSCIKFHRGVRKIQKFYVDLKYVEKLQKGY